MLVGTSTSMKKFCAGAALRFCNCTRKLKLVVISGITAGLTVPDKAAAWSETTCTAVWLV